MANLLDRLFGRTREEAERATSRLRLPDVRLSDVRMPSLKMPAFNLPEFKSFEAWDRQGRGDRAGALLIPAVLSLTGAGVAFIWWRQWARGGAEGEVAEAHEALAAPSHTDESEQHPIRPTGTEF